MAWALVPVLCAGITAPPAGAEGCSGAAAQAQPLPGQDVQIPSPGKIAPLSRPIGHKPVGANDKAPLPNIGQLLAQALAPKSATVQQQAAVAPVAPVPKPGTTQAPIAAAPLPAPAVSVPQSDLPPGTAVVGWVTGPDSPNKTIANFAVTGTDLGIMWDNGDPANNQVLMAFGDTKGFCQIPGEQWRYNVLMRSSDRTLANTIAIGGGAAGNRYAGAPVWRPGIAKQIVNTINAAPQETGIIPTAGGGFGGKQFLNFMSIKKWDGDGAWTTNYSALAVSTDNGETWGVYPGTLRTPQAGNEKFQMGAFLKPGPGDPYLYTYGTPSGRSGSAYVARVAPAVVPDLTKYEYWSSDANAWVPANPAAATAVIPGPVGEMSAQYNSYLKQYLALYTNRANDVVMRTAPAPQGPWGPEQVLVSSFSTPGGVYAPFLHPWSTGRELYYNVSLWSAYNVMLMRTVLP
jgi:hypothetical protein